MPVPTAINSPQGGAHFHPQGDPVSEFANKKIAAGICGILLGGFGVHKFILGFTAPGAIMLSVNLICLIAGMCLIVPMLGCVAMSVIGVIEGILYLTKSDREFYQMYAIERREWF